MNPYTDTVTMPICVFKLIIQQKRIIENADRHIVELREVVKKSAVFSVYKDGKVIRTKYDDGVE